MPVKIIESIKSAMVDCCNDSLNFTDEPSRKFNAEYLFTVNVAKSILRNNFYYADPYKIYLEKDRKKLAEDCSLPVVFGHPLKKRTTVFRGNPKNNIRGRADIAVYCDGKNKYIGNQPLCVIELKGFDPCRKKVIEDIKRNLQFHRIIGDTGNSVLKFSIFAAIYSIKRLRDDVGTSADIQWIKSKYEKWCSELGDCQDVDIKIDAFTVSKELAGRIIDDGEFYALDNDSRHHFIGVIVCVASKK